MINDEDLCRWIAAAIEYERLKRAGKEIPQDIWDALDWPYTLNASDYDALIH